MKKSFRFLPFLSASFCFCLFAPGVFSANLDINGAYRMNALDYSNLGLTTQQHVNRDFFASDGRIGLSVKNVLLKSYEDSNMTLDVGFLLHSLGASGQGVALSTDPFDGIAANYPSTAFTPFVENAYVKVHRAFGEPMSMVFGRQSFKLGTGLVLQDDGAGFTGASVKGALPWKKMTLQGFGFESHNAHFTSANRLELYGLDAVLPVQGTWSLGDLMQEDRPGSPVPLPGCLDPGTDCEMSSDYANFTDLSYKFKNDSIYFQGEFAMEEGQASGVAPTPSHVNYNGNAAVMEFKWKQPLYHVGTGIASLVVSHGSGDRGRSGTDSAFFPAHGHRFNGLQRDWYGYVFNASPYEAFGGNYDRAQTQSGLAAGASGIDTVGLGYTPPAYHGASLGLDYYYYQADQVSAGSKTLGNEFDLGLSYPIKDLFSLKAMAGFFTSGPASGGTAHAQMLGFEAYGRF